MDRHSSVKVPYDKLSGFRVMLQGFLEDHNCGFDTGILFSKLTLQLKHKFKNCLLNLLLRQGERPACVAGHAGHISGRQFHLS